MSNSNNQSIKFNNYELEQAIIGQGTYGKVYKAKNTLTGDTLFILDAVVAIKIINLMDQQKKQSLEIAKNQVKALKMLIGCQFIIKLHQQLKFQDKYLLVFQYCQNGDLFNAIVKEALTKRQIKHIMIQILKGYQQIRRKGLIHRDLKPSNILLCDNAQSVRICDFGFCIKEQQADKHRKQRVGSNFHMAPQIIRKNIYSEESDIWAIGVIYYEMLTGRYLWAGKTLKQVLLLIDQNPIQQLYDSQMDDIDKQFLRACLRIKKQERGTPSELLQILMKNDQPGMQYLQIQNSESKNNRWLCNILCIAKIQFYLIKLLTYLEERYAELNKFQLKYLLNNQANGKLNKIQQLCYLSDNEKKQFKNSNFYHQLISKIQNLTEKTQKYSIKIKSPPKNITQNLEQMLKWLHNNVTSSSHYLLFILYDYLITYRWLWNIRQNPQKPPEFSLKDPGFDLLSILNSLKRELQQKKRISNTNLEKLKFKLQKLNIVCS